MSERPNDRRRRERMRIGRNFLRWFPTKQPARLVGPQVGMSLAMVAQVEAMAAYKVVVRMRAELRRLEVTRHE